MNYHSACHSVVKGLRSTLNAVSMLYDGFYSQNLMSERSWLIYFLDLRADSTYHHMKLKAHLIHYCRQK
jgi:hypothetical protein